MPGDPDQVYEPITGSEQLSSKVFDFNKSLVGSTDIFLNLELRDSNNLLVAENFYAIPAEKDEYYWDFEKYDVILGPAAPTTAPKLGESLSDPLQMYLGDIYTISVNLAGLPGMTIPCGKDSKGLPIGLQLIGDCFKEKNIIRAGYAYECSRSYETPELAKAAEAKLDGGRIPN